MKKFALIILAVISILTAFSTCSACFWGLYQPELPKKNLN